MIPTYSEFVGTNYLEKWWNVTAKRYPDELWMRLVDEDFGEGDQEEFKTGCSIDFLPDQTLQGVKFATQDDEYIKNIAFRVKPLEEYYDNESSYEQNGDVYSIGYDEDFKDMKFEYKANGYSP